MVENISVKEFTLKLIKRDLRSVEDQIEKLQFRLKLLEDVKGKKQRQDKINALPTLINQFKGLAEQHRKEIAEHHRKKIAEFEHL